MSLLAEGKSKTLNELCVLQRCLATLQLSSHRDG